LKEEKFSGLRVWKAENIFRFAGLVEKFAGLEKNESTGKVFRFARFSF
jgi:hypothetical protein